MSSTTVQPLSNIEFISGGLYAGGQGKAKEFKYRLWDYNGRQAPNSNVAVYLLFSPTDGSNEGKDVEIYWNVGSATNFTPDNTGGKLLPVSRPGKDPIKGLSDNCNWHQAFMAFVGNCGLEPARLEGPNGIRIIEGSDLALTRVPQKARDFGDQADGVPANAPGGQGSAAPKSNAKGKDILVPTRAKYPWEMGGAMAAAANAGTAAPTANAAAGASPETLVKALAAVLASNPDGVALADIVKLTGDQLLLLGIKGKDRSLVLKGVKEEADVVALATANNWTWEDSEKKLYV